MSHHTRNLMLGLAILPMGVGNCAPVRNCAGNLINAIGQIVRDPLQTGVPDPTPDDPYPDPSQPMNCTVIVEPGDFTQRAPYTVVDPRGSANGWGWYTACVIKARALGRSLPAIKINGIPNDPSQVPIIHFYIDSAPTLFGRGHGHYADPAGSSFEKWRAAYVEAVPG